MSQPTVGSYSPGGVIVGADAPAPQYVPGPPVVSSQQFSADDLTRARQQEKDKLYPQLEQLKAEVERLRQEREAQAALEQQHREVAEAEQARLAEDARKKVEEEMSLRQLLETRTQEMELRFQEMQRERDRQEAIIVKEQQLRELVTYREQQKAAAVDTIVPELLDLVDGSTFEEIDASIARLQAKSAAILEQVREATQTSRASQVGVRPYGGPTGADPLDTYSEKNPADMSMAEYMEYRKSNPPISRSDRGLFG